MINKKKFSVLLLMMLSFVGKAATPLTIHFATEATYPPYAYVNNKGQIIGFDPALSRAICAELKAKCTITNQPWDSLIPSLKLRKFDVLMGALQITKKRLKQVAFTIPYEKSTASLLTPIAKPLSLNLKSLKGKTLGVLGASTQATYLFTTFKNNITINRYLSVQLALLDLQIGRTDGVLGDTPVIKRWMRLHGKKEFTISAVTDDPKYFGLGIAMAVRKDDKALLKQLNQALRSIERKSIMSKLKKEYFK